MHAWLQLAMEYYNICVFLELHPPPDNVHLGSVTSRALTFNWNSVNTSCHAFAYSIASTNCGVCPINTTDTSVTCVNVSADGSVCMFQVQTTVCNNNHGPLSTSVPITLKGEFILCNTNHAVCSQYLVYMQYQSFH